MTILAQSGHGRANKLERGIQSGSIAGVIMSPLNETPAKLASFLSGLSAFRPNSERLVDPQNYVGTIPGAKDKKLQKYNHYKSNLVLASFSPAVVRNIVRETLDWQRNLDVSAILTPTVMVDDLGGRWAQIAMMLAQESITESVKGESLLISHVVSEDALRDMSSVDAWLDELTQLNVAGFYLIVARSIETYRQSYDPQVLAALLRVCYSLGELNQYRVYVGYTDMVTLLLHAVGVSGIAAGWYTNLRQFTKGRFEPVEGGNPARTRYSSRPLLNSIFMTELDGIYSGGYLSQVLSGTSYDARFNANTNPENVPWPRDQAALHHWEVLADISQSIQGTSIGDRLDSARNIIGHAQAVYTHARTLVPFANETGPTHLDQWLEGLNRFRVDIGV